MALIADRIFTFRLRRKMFTIIFNWSLVISDKGYDYGGAIWWTGLS